MTTNPDPAPLTFDIGRLTRAVEAAFGGGIADPAAVARTIAAEYAALSGRDLTRDERWEMYVKAEIDRIKTAAIGR
jgi:hypothetical protein